MFFDFKNTIENKNFHFLMKICEIAIYTIYFAKNLRNIIKYNKKKSITFLLNFAHNFFKENKTERVIDNYGQLKNCLQNYS